MTDDTPASPATDETAQGGILDDYLTDDELANELGIHKRTLARWDALGEGPKITRVGRKKLRRRVTARQWLADREGEAA